MITTLSESTPVARKKYDCNACEWIDNVMLDNLRDYEVPYSELKQIVKAKRQGWKILPGQKYVKQVNVSGGDFWVFRAIPEMHKICIKYDLYEEV